MAIALVLVLIVVGSILFHVFSPWWWTPIASNWGFIDTTLIITFWITGIAFAAVVLFMAYCVWKFRHKEGRKAEYEPENRKVELWLTGITTVGVAALLAPGLIVWYQFVTVPDEATEIEVFAQQWYWSYRLPGEDGQLGRSDARFVSADNPLGLDPEDPAGQDDVIVVGGDLHLPGRPPRARAAAVGGRAAQLLRSRVPRQDGHGAGHGDVFLVHPDADRRVRGALRRALRGRARDHARLRADPERGGLPRLARGADDLRGDVGAGAGGGGAAVTRLAASGTRTRRVRVWMRRRRGRL
jgi:hypothetical protein